MTRLLLDRPVETGARIEIRDDELHYLTRVRRHRKGEPLEVRDPRGRAFRAEIESWRRDRASLLIAEEITPTDAAQPIHPVELAVAVPKRNLFDQIVRQVSEVGVRTLHPIITARTVGRPGAEKLERWRRLADESMRQCGRPHPLQVSPVSSFDDVIDGATTGTRLLLHTDAEGANFDPWSPQDGPEQPILIAIGPEGGFSPEEVDAARARGFRTVHLEMPVLRVETAAIAAGVMAAGLLQQRRDALPPLTS